MNARLPRPLRAVLALLALVTLAGAVLAQDLGVPRAGDGKGAAGPSGASVPAPPGKADRERAYERTEAKARAYRQARDRLAALVCSGDASALAKAQSDFNGAQSELEYAMSLEAGADRDVYQAATAMHAAGSRYDRAEKDPSVGASDLATGRADAIRAASDYLKGFERKKAGIVQRLEGEGTDFSTPRAKCPPKTAAAPAKPKPPIEEAAKPLPPDFIYPSGPPLPDIPGCPPLPQDILIPPPGPPAAGATPGVPPPAPTPAPAPGASPTDSTSIAPPNPGPKPAKFPMPVLPPAKPATPAPAPAPPPSVNGGGHGDVGAAPGHCPNGPGVAMPVSATGAAAAPPGGAPGPPVDPALAAAQAWTDRAAQRLRDLAAQAAGQCLSPEDREKLEQAFLEAENEFNHALANEALLAPGVGWASADLSGSLGGPGERAARETFVKLNDAARARVLARVGPVPTGLDDGDSCQTHAVAPPGSTPFCPVPPSDGSDADTRQQVGMGPPCPGQQPGLDQHVLTQHVLPYQLKPAKPGKDDGSSDDTPAPSPP